MGGLMGVWFRQFLGSAPGMRVELINDASSPYTVRTESGFEFYVGAEDFRTFYHEEESSPPKRWGPFITDHERMLAESGKMLEILNVVRSFESRTGDYDDARVVARNAVKIARSEPPPDWDEFSRLLSSEGYNIAETPPAALSRIKSLTEDIAELLAGDSCAVIPLFSFEEMIDGVDTPQGPDLVSGEPSAPDAPARAAKAKAAGGIKRANMRNVELSVEGDTLTVRVDLSKDFGPSKSGRTIIVASTLGNKGLPGREEKIGLNIYREEPSRGNKGRKTEFKNVLMAVEGDSLTLTMDLTVELGPSKSGQTILLASTGGNQLIFGREEKIGLNVYRSAGVK